MFDEFDEDEDVEFFLLQNALVIIYFFIFFIYLTLEI